MEELTLGLIGLAVIYSIIHFFILQHSRNYKQRTQYQKVVSWTAIVSMGLMMFGVMFG